MSTLTEQARGETCQVRAPGICDHDTETTVCAHVRMIGYSGMGMKANDWFTAFACSACHDYVDGRSPSMDSYETRRLALLEGAMRTQAIRLQRQHFMSEGPHCPSCTCGMSDPPPEAPRLESLENQ